MSLLTVSNLRKSFLLPEGTRQAVVNVPEFAMEPQTEVGLSGESGSGKTTFLHLLAGILTPDSGTVTLQSSVVSALPESARDRLRATSIGYIFQSFNLLQGYTCLENVLVAMSFGKGIDRGHARELLSRVGLTHRLDHYPRQLSTGQQQRLAVARALSNRPALVLADEPTGNLDRRNTSEVLALIRSVCRENSAALLLVSHDRDVLAQFDRGENFESLNRIEML